MGERSANSAPGEMILATSSDSRHGPTSFTISGTKARNLFPGASKKIDLTFANTSAIPLRITSVQGRLTSTSRKGCLPLSANLTISGYNGRLPVLVRPWSRKAAGSLTVFMPRSVSNACQGTTFEILLTGRASKAER
jgi:hypothetical protein